MGSTGTTVGSTGTSVGSTGTTVGSTGTTITSEGSTGTSITSEGSTGTSDGSTGTSVGSTGTSVGSKGTTGKTTESSEIPLCLTIADTEYIGVSTLLSSDKSDICSQLMIFESKKLFCISVGSNVFFISSLLFDDSIEK